MLQRAIPVSLIVGIVAAVIFQVTRISVYAQIVNAKFPLLFAEHIENPLIRFFLRHVDRPVVPVSVEVEHPFRMLQPNLGEAIGVPTAASRAGTGSRFGAGSR